MAEAIQSNLSDEDATKMCDPCLFRGINTHAGTQCQVCSEHLCDTCEAVHRSSKASRDHELKPFKESQRLSIKQRALISSIMTCDVHRKETLTHICVSHNVPICGACKSVKHRKCNTKTLKQISKERKIKNAVLQCTNNSKTLISDIKEIKDSRENEQNLIRACSRKCIQKVKRIKNQIISWAEKLTKDMEHKIENKQIQLLTEIEGDINAVVQIGNQMQDIVKSIEILGKNIEDAAFVLMMKEKGNIEDGIEVKNEILNLIRPVTLEFQQSDKLLTLMSKLTSMGRLEVKEQQISKPKTVERPEHQISFLDISSTKNKMSIETGTSFVSGCTFLSDGELVICDNANTSVKVLSRDFKIKNELKFGSCVWDVAVVSKTEVIVTIPDSKSLQFLNMSKSIDKGECIPVGMKCWGIDCQNENIYVSCHKNDGKGGMVKVLTIDGVSVSTFNISQGLPYNMAVNISGDRILVSTSRYGVVCMDNMGNILYTYSDSQLKRNRGLMLDSYDNLMVCGQSTNNIHVVKSDGTRHMIILSRDDEAYGFSCLAYRPSDNALVIGQLGRSDSLLALTITYK